MLKNWSMHRNCYCYYNGNNPVIEILTYPRSQIGTVHLVSHEIVFVMEGRLHLTVKDHYDLNCELNTNEFVFMPTGSTIEYRIIDDTTMLIFRQTDEMQMPICHNEMFKIKLDNLESDESIHALQANERINHYIEGLILTIEDGLICNLYMQYEIYKMLFLIHSYYTKEECARFFAPLASPDAKFSEFVRLNYHKYKTVERMAEAMRMSQTQFTKRFKSIFLLTPKEWFLRMRARRIHWELYQGKKQIKEIADEYGFLPENLIRFCKQRLGATPAVIRKNGIPQGQERNQCTDANSFDTTTRKK